MDYEELAKQGRLLVLPVPMGGLLWRVREQRRTMYHAANVYVQPVTLSKNNFFNIVFGDELGRVVFLTKTEAEQRRKELLAQLRE